MDLCLRLQKESIKSKFNSYSVRNSALIISHITFRDCRMHIFSHNLFRKSCILHSLQTLLSLACVQTFPLPPDFFWGRGDVCTQATLFCLFQYNIILLSSRWLDFSYCLEIIFNLWFHFLQYGNCFCHGWPLPRLLSNTTGHQVSKDLICNHGDLFLSMVRHRKLTNAHLTQQQTKAEHINLEEQKIFCKCVKKSS